jgi:hypothetical protein
VGRRRFSTLVKTTSALPKKVIARVAINVRLYFDVPVSSEGETDIRQAARVELERAAYEEWIVVEKLRKAAIYPIDDWPAMKPTDFDVCPRIGKHAS